jgi:hypothetical protein
MKKALLIFLLMIGSANAGGLEEQCEKSFTEFLETLGNNPRKLSERFFYEPIGKDLVRMEGCRDYRKMYPKENAKWIMKLWEIFKNSSVEKVTIKSIKDGRIDAIVIMKKENGWTRHEAIFLEGIGIAVYCKEAPVPCDKEGN